MKVRLYDAGKQYEGYPDRYALYFPVPKALQKREGRGVFLGCSPNSQGEMIRCCWDENRDAIVNGARLFLGKIVPLETMPVGFQKTARRLEEAWNNAVKYDNEKYWELWNNA